MSAFTVHIPDDLAQRLASQKARLPEILERGLRDVTADMQPGFDGAADLLEILASLPSAAEVIELRPTDRMRVRIEELLDKNRIVGLTPAEQMEWDRYEYLEHLVRIAKTHAQRRLNAMSVDGRS